MIFSDWPMVFFYAFSEFSGGYVIVTPLTLAKGVRVWTLRLTAFMFSVRTPNLQSVSDKRTMTAPWHRFSTH
jgi:hypothetical protein